MERENRDANGLEASNPNSMVLTMDEKSNQSGKDQSGVENGEPDVELSQSINIGMVAVLRTVVGYHRVVNGIVCWRRDIEELSVVLHGELSFVVGPGG